MRASAKAAGHGDGEVARMVGAGATEAGRVVPEGGLHQPWPRTRKLLFPRSEASAAESAAGLETMFGDRGLERMIEFFASHQEAE
nr:hypothetical protein [Streptomyces sp. CoT10]